MSIDYRFFWSVVIMTYLFRISAFKNIDIKSSKTNFFSSADKGQIVSFWFKPKIVLNGESIGNKMEKYVETPNQLVKDIRNKMLEIKSSCFSADGKSINYKSLKNTEIFTSYLNLVGQLKYVDLKAFSNSEKKSFYINIYNCLILHAIIDELLDVNGGTLARMKLYATASYDIGGMVYSLNDIENGLLRGNRKSAVPLTSLPFREESDVRRQFTLNCDPRIHFALNCGAVSCPPIGVYSYDEATLDAELSIATKGFLDQTVVFEPSKRTVYLSMLFNWYKEDFGGNDESILDWMKNYGSNELKKRYEQFEKEIYDNNNFIKEPRFGDIKFKIKYSPYDWSVNEL